MHLKLAGRLPFLDGIVVHHAGQNIRIPDVLVDTGSAGTILDADLLADIGIIPTGTDRVYTVYGIGGGEETVFEREVTLQINNHLIENFAVEIGTSEGRYGILGIIGLDLLMHLRAVLDLGTLTLTIPE